MTTTLPAPAAAGTLATLPSWEELTAGCKSEETMRAYRRDWRHFLQWCQNVFRSPLPADPHTVAAYLRAESDAGVAVASVRRRAATIAFVHRTQQLPDPTKHPGVKETMAAIANTRGTDQKQAAPLVQRLADRIVDRSTDGLKAARDLALVLIGRDLLARASELVSLNVEAITWQDNDTALVSMRRHKTEKEARPYLIGEEAARALRVWLTLSGITAGALWRSVTKGPPGYLKPGALGVRDVGRIVKALAGKKYSAHSLRRGMAHDMVAIGLETGVIMQAGGWKSPQMIARYTQDLEAERGAVAQYHARRGKQ